jgi:hypothetical protein
VNDRTNQPTTSTPTDTEPTAYELAERIAKHMPGPARWIPTRRVNADGEEMTQSAELIRDADGACIGLHVGGFRQQGRVSFRTNWPKYHDGRIYQPRAYPSITCSAGRDGKALAREIERRLLVDYNPAYRAALDAVRASDAAAGEAWRTAERIGEAIGAELPAASRAPRNGEAVQLRGGPESVWQLSVHPGYDGSPATVRLELHDLDEKTALRVLAILAGSGEGER